MSPQAAAGTLDYYTQRTDPDGPAMTDAVHAVDAAEIGAPGCATHTYLTRSAKPFIRAPFSQFAEARGNVTGVRAGEAALAAAFNFLTGAGGFEQVFTHGLTGLRLREGGLRVDPLLPPQLSGGVLVKGVRWRGRTLDVELGPATSTVRPRRGRPFEVEARGQRTRVTRGAPLAIATRRPDLTPTDNLARCAAAKADSEEPGLYAEAAVDGSAATFWTPAGAAGTLEVDLGQPRAISSIEPAWTEARPGSVHIQVSADGRQWTDGVGPGRYVRVVVGGAIPGRTGLRELVVR